MCSKLTPVAMADDNPYLMLTFSIGPVPLREKKGTECGPEI